MHAPKAETFPMLKRITSYSVDYRIPRSIFKKLRGWGGYAFQVTVSTTAAVGVAPWPVVAAPAGQCDPASLRRPGAGAL